MHRVCLLGLLLVSLLAAVTGCGRVAPRQNITSFDSNGVKLAYSVEGDGEPVILIHGWLSSAGVNWGLPGTAAMLAKTNQVIALDVRGHGLSDKPTNLDAYGMELVEDIVRLMDHLMMKKAHIVGYSMGGIITAKFVSKHPDRVLSAALCGAGWLKEGSLEHKTFAGGGSDGKAAGLCFKSLADLALTEDEIRSIKVPVCTIIGADDFLKYSYVEPLKKVRPDWPSTEIKGGDHLSCIVKAQFRETISAWVAKNKQQEK